MPGIARAAGSIAIATGAPRLGPKPPEVTVPTGSDAARVGKQPRPCAHRTAAFRTQADAAAGRARGDLGEDAARPREPARPPAAGAARGGDRPGEPRLDGRCSAVDVGPVQAQAGFEPQGIAGAETDRHHGGVGEQRLGQGLGARLRHRDLEAVLARVAGAGDEAGMTEDRDLDRVHEAHRRHRGGEAGEDALGLRTLERDERAVEQRRRHRGGKVGAQMREVGGRVGGVDDQHQPVAETGHHQIVADAAGGVGQQPVALAAGPQSEDVGRDQRLEGARGLDRVGGFERDLAHVGDVEQARLRAGVQVLPQQPGRVVQRHVVAGKRHHPRPMAQVQGVQRRPPRRGRGSGAGSPEGRCVHLVGPRR